MAETIQAANNAAKEILPRYKALDKITSANISDEAKARRAKGLETLEKAANDEPAESKDLRHAAKQLNIMANIVPYAKIPTERPAHQAIITKAQNEARVQAQNDASTLITFAANLESALNYASQPNNAFENEAKTRSRIDIRELEQTIARNNAAELTATIKPEAREADSRTNDPVKAVLENTWAETRGAKIPTIARKAIKELIQKAARENHQPNDTSPAGIIAAKENGQAPSR